MKTIILSGGLGYRLKEETEFKPKPMVLIGGKPILWHIMKIYEHHGYKDFIIALGYKGAYIKEHFLNQKYLDNDFFINTRTGDNKIIEKDHSYSADDFNIQLIDTGLETLPGERILKLKKLIPKEDEDFMVTYGDGVADIDLKKLVKFHKRQNTVGTITGVYPKGKYGILAVDSNNRATKFTEKPEMKEWVNGGFMVFKKSFFKYLKKGEMEHEAIRRLVGEGQLSVYRHRGFWQSMDTYSDVINLNSFWETDPKWKVWQD